MYVYVYVYIYIYIYINIYIYIYIHIYIYIYIVEGFAPLRWVWEGTYAGNSGSLLLSDSPIRLHVYIIVITI